MMKEEINTLGLHLIFLFASVSTEYVFIIFFFKMIISSRLVLDYFTQTTNKTHTIKDITIKIYKKTLIKNKQNNIKDLSVKVLLNLFEYIKID